MVQYLLPVVQEEIAGSSALDDLQVALDDMASQLNGDPAIDTFFVDFTPTTSVIDTKPKNFSSEMTYLENVLEEMDNNGDLLDGDLVVIADSGAVGDGLGDIFGYGFGGATWSPPDDSSREYAASRVLHTPSQTGVPDPVETFYNLAIHEAAHALTDRSIDDEGIDADHASGTYDIESGLFFENARDVSPLATSYTEVNGITDTAFPGGSDVPGDFCGGISNGAAEQWCAPSGCRHTTEMSECTKSSIEAGTPL